MLDKLGAGHLESYLNAAPKVKCEGTMCSDGLGVLFLKHDVIPFWLWFVRARIASAQQIYLL